MPKGSNKGRDNEMGEGNLYPWHFVSLKARLQVVWDNWRCIVSFLSVSLPC